MEEMEGKMKELEKTMRSTEWRVLGDESRMDGRMALVEGRIAALELQADEEEEPWTRARAPRRRPARDFSDRSVSRNMLQRVEGKADAATREASTLRSRVSHLERTTVNVEEMRKKLEEMGIDLTKMQDDMAQGDKRIRVLEEKREAGLRHDLLSREISLGLVPRVAKLESRVAILDYRQGTTELQAGWTEQKFQGFWSVISSPSVSDTHVRTEALRVTWNEAARECQVRVAATPVLPPTVNIAAASRTSHPSTNPFVPRVIYSTNKPNNPNDKPASTY